MAEICVSQAELMQALQKRGVLNDETVEGEENFEIESSSSVSELFLSDEETQNKTTFQDYHYAENAKVLGVHKREGKKSVYLFVIIVRWNDKSNVTIYRTWKNIKQLQTELLRVAKNTGNDGNCRRYLKRTAQRVVKMSRFHQGTMRRLNMIDSLNQYFEAVLHFKDLAQSIATRKFFKPNDTDLSSVSWSGDGRTYFYVTRDVLGERNNGFVNEPDDDFSFDEEEDDADFNVGISHDSQNMDEAIDKYCEADPSISWPMNSSIHVAKCDYETSESDVKQNIINLRKGEEVDVLDRNECGWWLVSRMRESKSKTPECGYVPASYLESKKYRTRSSDSNLSPTFPNTEKVNEGSPAVFSDEDEGFNSAYSVSNESSPTGHGFAESFSDRQDSLELSKSQEEDNVCVTRHSPTPSSSSAESLHSLPSTPIPFPRRKTLAIIDCAPTPKLSASLDGRTGSLNSLDPTALSGATLTAPQQQLKSLWMRRMTCGVLPSHVTSSPDLTKKLSRSAGNSPSISRNPSLLSLTRRGIEYISLKEYNARNDDELSFGEDAIISVFKRNSNGWWTASYQGKTGLVPGVNLKRYQDPMRKLSLHVLDML